MKLCSIAGCERKYRTTGMCSRHYDISRYLNRREKYLSTKKRWYEETKPVRAASMKRWKKNNPDKVAVLSKRYTLRREAQLELATPKWVNPIALQLIMGLCPEGYEIDHSVPLLSKQVSGLHTPWNLRYITKDANRLKNNKLLPEIAFGIPPELDHLR